MVKGSVTVVLMWGLALVLLSCLAFALGAVVITTRLAALLGAAGLLLGLAGAIMIVFAILVALIRRETDR